MINIYFFKTFIKENKIQLLRLINLSFSNQRYEL